MPTFDKVGVKTPSHIGAISAGQQQGTWSIIASTVAVPQENARLRRAEPPNHDKSVIFPIAILGDDRHPGRRPTSRRPSTFQARLADRFRQAGFDVTVLDTRQATDPDVLNSAEILPVRGPVLQHLSGGGFETLLAFIEQRGHVLFLGGPLLDDPIWWLQDRWFNRQDVLEAKRNVQAEHRPVHHSAERRQDWTRTSNLPGSRGAGRSLPDGPDGEGVFSLLLREPDRLGWLSLARHRGCSARGMIC
jgi:hypothetical protein